MKAKPQRATMHECAWRMKAELYEKQYVALLEKFVESGLFIWGRLPQVQKDRLTLMEYLRLHHGNIKVNPNALYTLSGNIRAECKDALHTIFGKTLKTKQRIDDVFSRRKRSRKQDDNPHQFNPRGI
jgi:hypothetical protein